MPFTAPIFVKLTFAEWISSVSDFTQIGQACIEAGEGIQREKPPLAPKNGAWSCRKSLTCKSSEVSVELVVFHELKPTDIVAILSSYRQQRIWCTLLVVVHRALRLFVLDISILSAPC